MKLGTLSLGAVALTAVLGASSMAQAATIVDLGINTIGNGDAGWTLPGQGDPNWWSGTNVTAGTDGGPHDGIDFWVRASTSNISSSTKVSATSTSGDTIIAGDYIFTYAGAVGWTSPFTVRFSAIDAQTGDVLGSVDQLEVSTRDGNGQATADHYTWTTTYLNLSVAADSQAIVHNIKLQFEAVDDFSSNHFFLITDVAASVEAAVVPEPASLSLLGLGVVALLRRRK